MTFKIPKFTDIVLFVFLFLLIPPSVLLLGFNLPIIYMFIPIMLFIFVFILIGRIKVPINSKPMIYLWILIILEVTISGIFGPMYLFNRFNFPSEILQYIARFLFFITFIVLFYNSKTSEKVFLRLFISIMLIAMSIAIMQWLPWPGQGFMLQQYKQVNRTILPYGGIISRVPGIASMATATGGLAAFNFAISLSMLITKHNYRRSAIVGIIFSIVNFLACQARGGMLAAAVTLIFLYYVNGKSKKQVIRNLMKLLFIIVVISGLLVFLYNDGNKYVVQTYNRWIRLFDQVGSGGNRLGQINRALELLNDPYTVIFGVSRGFQALSSITFHIEVEYINILVLYGVLGFLLQYGLVVYLLVYYYKNLKIVKDNNSIYTLTLASLGGLFSYQVFSVAYFFFREINVGIFPWILFGATIGIIERYKKEKITYKKITN